MGGRYVPLSDGRLTAIVRSFIERQAAAEYHRRCKAWETQAAQLEGEKEELQPRQPGLEVKQAKDALKRLEREVARHAKGRPAAKPKVGRELVAAVAQAVRARCQLPDDTAPDTWLDGSNRGRVLAVANGLLDTAAGTLAPHTPDFFTLAALPVRFDPDAPPPARWLAFVRDATEGDADRAAVLQEVAGACLDPHLPVKFFAVLTGGGDNGKSVYLTGLRAALGAGNCAAVPLDRLGERFGSFALLGKLANLVGDQGYVESRDEGRLKTLTGGDLMEFEQKGRDALAAVNTARLVFASNTPPTFADKSEALWNRLVIVPFTWTVPPDKKDSALLTEAFWAAELPGVLNWMLGGLRRLRANGRFTPSAACEAAKGGHRRDSNPAREFLLGGYTATGDDADRVTVATLYEKYREWCMEGGLIHRLTKIKFGKEVRATFPSLADPKDIWQPGKTELGEKAGTYKKWVGLKVIAADPPPPRSRISSRPLASLASPRQKAGNPAMV